MIDFTPNSQAKVLATFTSNGAPLLGATVTVTIVDPSGSTLVNTAGASEVGGGQYSYGLTNLQTVLLGTYHVQWNVTSPIIFQQNSTFVVGYQSAFNVSRLDVRQAVGRILGDFTIGQATSGTTSTLVDPQRNEPDGHFIGWWLYIYGGTGSGQERRVTAWTQSTTSFTVSNHWTTPPDSTSLYELSHWFRNDEINQAIRLAIMDIADTVLVPISDSSIILNSNQTRYTIPPGFSHIFEVQVNTMEDIFQKVAPGAWGVNRANRELILHQNIRGPWSAKNIRILGLRPPQDPISDSTGIDIRPTYVIRKAAAWLAFSRMAARENDPQGWTFKHQVLEGEAQQERNLINKGIPNNTRRVEL